ncbi:MAG: SDR family NAD(P)-dependent oxidoreductase [Phycisphaerales bacterium]|nr:SDR family NAD(P)-dependent oxidoreductase [Phycisphaerales bacterium]
MIDLRGKPIVITGASSGIGAATAVVCARAGMPVGLFARREEKLLKVKERIEHDGGRAIVVVGDAADPESNLELIAKAGEAFGDLYAAIANAGYGAEVECATMPIEDIRAMFEVNFYGSMHLVQPAIAGFRERGAGHAMMVSSCLSKIGLPNYGAYCASKAAQDHFSRAMRHELRGSGVYVSSVHPVGTKTEFFDEAAKKSGGGKLRLAGSSERFMQTPERVAGAMVRCLQKPRGEVWTSTLARLGFGASVMMPGVTDWVLGRMMEKRRRD